MAASLAEDDPDLGVGRRFLARLPFHLLTVAGGFCTAWILNRGVPATPGSSAAIDLLRYLPVLIGLSANTGVQSSTLFVRGLATGAIDARAPGRALAREGCVGLLTGVFAALLALALVPVVEGGGADARDLSWALAAALLVALSWAALAGGLVCLGVHALGRDPAVGAGPLAILIGDVSSAALYMGTAWWVREVLA